MNKGLQNVGRFLATGALALGVSGCEKGSARSEKDFEDAAVEDAEMAADISAEIQGIAFNNYRQIVATIKIGNDYDVDQALFLSTQTIHGSYRTAIEPLKAGFSDLRQNFDQNLVVGETLGLALVNARDEIVDQLQVVVPDLNQSLPEVPK